MSLFSELKRRNVLRVAIAYVAGAWLIIQVVETLFPIYGLSEAPVKLVTTVLFIGLPIALVFSWVYEFTPEGLKLEKDIDPADSVTHHTGKKFDRAIIVVLTLALGYFAVDKFLLDPARDAEIEKSAIQRGRSEALVESYGENSIAVLAFVNMSDDTGNEYFSDGISEELLNSLARIPEIRVTSRSSSFYYKDKDFTIAEVAEQLEVNLVVEGSVRSFGDELVITAQLIDANSDTQLWSVRYSRNADDLFAIQEDIASAIVVALTDKLGIDISSSILASTAVNRKAYDAFLAGRYLLAQRTPDSMSDAVRAFEKAILLEPDYALAHAELAISFSLGANAERMTAAERIAVTKHHIDSALSLNPDLAEAHAAKGRLVLRDGRPEEALSHFRRAIQINASYTDVYIWMAGIFGGSLRYDEEFAAIETALRLDPVSSAANFNYVAELIERNRLDDADREIARFAKIAPREAMVLRGIRSSIGGNWSNFILAFLEAAIDGQDDLVYGYQLLHLNTVWILAAIGLEEEALSMANGKNPQLIAWFGNSERAIALAESRYSEGRNSGQTLIDLGFVFAHLGLYPEARPHLEELWPQQGPELEGSYIFTVYLAEALVAVRRAADNKKGADQVLAALNDNIHRLHDAGFEMTEWDTSLDYQEGVALYLVGKRDAGLALMSKAAEDGFWIPPESAFQEERFQDREFNRILERQEARSARERDKVLAVVCNDNPYATVWQPSEETCSRFVLANE